MGQFTIFCSHPKEASRIEMHTQDSLEDPQILWRCRITGLGGGLRLCISIRCRVAPAAAGLRGCPQLKLEQFPQLKVTIKVAS